MDKPGSRNIRIGMWWIIGGVVLTAGSSLIFPGSGGILFFGAVVVGAWQVLVGIWHRIRYASKSPAEQKLDRARATVGTLLRAMVMVANADGQLDDSEIETICIIYENLTGLPIDPSEVYEIAENAGHGGSDPMAGTVECVRTLAEQGNASAQFLLGGMYATGEWRTEG